MIKTISIFLLLIAPISVVAQKAITTGASEKAVNPYGKYYHKPSFDCGDSCLTAYLIKNMHYPNAARENEIEGIVTVKFMIEKDGSVTHAAIIRSIGGGCDEEAIRIVRSFHKWKPATYKNKPVDAYFTLPIIFKLV